MSWKYIKELKPILLIDVDKRCTVDQGALCGGSIK